MKMVDLFSQLEEAASNPDPVKVEIPEWKGAKVRLIPFTPASSEEFTEAQEDAADGGEISPMAIIIATVVEHMVDDDGGPVFDYEDEEHQKIIHNLDIAGYRRCLDAMNEHAMGKSEIMEGNLRSGKAKYARGRKRRR